MDVCELTLKSKSLKRLVVLGAPQVGKTSIVARFLNNNRDINENYTPTIENFHRKLYKINGKLQALDILDMSGNNTFPAGRRLTILTGDLFLVIYSVDSYESFRGMTDLLNEIMVTKYEALSRDAPLQPPPIVVIGNKADREAQRVVGRQEAESAVARRGGVPLFETSAKSNANVVVAFARLFERARLPVEMCPSMHSVLPTLKMLLLQRSSWLNLLGRCSRAEAYGVVIPNVRRPCLSSELEKIQGGKFKAGKLGNRYGK